MRPEITIRVFPESVFGEISKLNSSSRFPCSILLVLGILLIERRAQQSKISKTVCANTNQIIPTEFMLNTCKQTDATGENT